MVVNRTASASVKSLAPSATDTCPGRAGAAPAGTLKLSRPLTSMWPRSSKSPADPGRPISVTRWPARARAAEKASPSEPVPTIDMRTGEVLTRGPGESAVVTGGT